MADPSERLTYKCRDCPRRVPVGKFKCQCGAWNFAAASALGKGDSDGLRVTSLAQAKKRELVRLSCGHPELNRFFGGRGEHCGIVATSTFLLGGRPGGGKSTLELMLLSHWAKVTGKKVVIIANEQTDDEIAEKGGELGIDNLEEILVIDAMGGFSAAFFEWIERNKPGAFAIDSVSKLVGQDLALAVLVAQIAKQTAVHIHGPGLLINQVTKDLDHAGLEALQHEVDATALIEAEGARRLMISEKNRNGEAPLVLSMAMATADEFAAGRGGLKIDRILSDDGEDDEEEEKKHRGRGEWLVSGKP